MQRRLAAPAGQRHIRLGLEQHRRHRVVAALGREVQRGVAAFVLGVYVRPSCEMFFDRILEAVRRCSENRAGGFDLLRSQPALVAEQLGQGLIFTGKIQCGFAPALGVDLCPFFKQQRNRLRLAIAHRQVQWRVAVFVRRIHIRAGLKQFFDRLHVAHLGRGKNILGRSQFPLRLAALAPKQLSDGGTAFSGGIIQRGLAVFILGIDRRALLEKQRRRGLPLVAHGVMQGSALGLVGQGGIGFGVNQCSNRIHLPGARRKV